MKNRYAILRFIGSIYKIIGAILAIIVGALGLLIGVGIAAISQYAIGEAIYLFLSIEENTRTTAYLLQKRETIPPSPAAPPVE